ncbi:MAG: ankyrin repeat domain-containing protein [Campylobacterota bacterium]|nr:ankyrin repeat domain-containing protein [Campylobacterota bacterium]
MQTWITLLETNDFIGIKKYLKSGADVNELNDHDESVLALALRLRCDNDTIDLIVNSGADLNEFDEEGVSIFDNTITYNNAPLFYKLLEDGVDVNMTQRKSRFTPLMAAVCYGRSEMVKALLKHGAKKEMADFKGFKASDFARKMNKKSMLSLLET